LEADAPTNEARTYVVALADLDPVYSGRLVPAHTHQSQSGVPSLIP
jgi:hypothetical protein